MKPDLRVVRTMPVQKPGKSKQDYGTPRSFLDAVERRFGKIDLDLAATTENAVASFWITEEEDSLSDRIDWDHYHRNGCKLAFLNPPFGSILPWAKKCAEAETLPVMFLVPASVGSNWWARYVHGAATRVMFLRPRLSFDGKAPYPKDCALILYHRGVPKDVSYECWDWKAR